MPSLFTRLAGLIPGYQPNGLATVPKTAAPPRPIMLPPETPEERQNRVVAETKRVLEQSSRRMLPSTDEKIPANYNAGIAGKVWFLPYQDSATQDSPEIRAAMRQMLRHPWVKSAWLTQILSVASESIQVSASEKGNAESEAQAKFVKAVLEEDIAGGTVSLVGSIAMPLGPDGFSVCEPVFDIKTGGPRSGHITCKAVKAKDPEHLRIEGDRYRNVTHVQSLRAAGERWPISDFLFTRYMPIFDEPLGMAAFRASYGNYWMDDTVSKLRIIHHEKKMAGMLMGTYANDDDKPTLEAALRQAKTATWLAVPEGCRVEAVALSTASEPDYKSFQESNRESIVTGITFAVLQMMQGTVPDARGNSDVQKQTSDLAPWLIAALVMDTINRQLIPRLIDYNFPFVAGGGYPKATLGAVSLKEMSERLDFVLKLQQAGFKLKRKHYAADLSVQEADPNEPDDTLAPQPPPPPPPMGGGVPFSEGGTNSWRDVHTFANWKPYTSPKSGRSGWISDGGLVRYEKPKGPDDKVIDSKPAAKPEEGSASGKVKKADHKANFEKLKASKPDAVKSILDAHAKVKAGELTADERVALAGHLKSLSMHELRAVKDHLGIKANVSYKEKAVGNILEHFKTKAESPTAISTPPPPAPPPPPPAPAKPARGFPDSPAGLTTTKTLGGSTGAVQVKDAAGGMYVKKQNATNPGHLKSEHAADGLYRVVGLATPDAKLYDTPQGPVKLAKWADGKDLGKWEQTATAAEKEAVHKKIREGFVADALFANYDVVGLSKDNIKVTPDGQVLRIDNGGSLDYRAQGKKKDFGPKVTELDSMRDPAINQASASVFKGITDAEIKTQIDGLLAKRESILAATPEHLRETMGKRLDDLKEWKPKESQDATFDLPDAPTPEPAKPKKKSIKGANKAIPDAARPDLGKEEIDAIKAYTGEAYYELNDSLRKGKPLPKNLESVHAGLQKAFDVAQPFGPPPVIARRGVDITGEALDNWVKKAREAMQNSKEFRMDGYISTSVVKPGKDDDAHFDGKLQLHIEAIEGLDVKPYSGYKHENELLINHGESFKIKKIEKIGGEWHVHMEQLPQAFDFGDVKVLG